MLTVFTGDQPSVRGRLRIGLLAFREIDETWTLDRPELEIPTELANWLSSSFRNKRIPLDVELVRSGRKWAVASIKAAGCTLPPWPTSAVESAWLPALLPSTAVPPRLRLVR